LKCVSQLDTPNMCW